MAVAFIIITIQQEQDVMSKGRLTVINPTENYSSQINGFSVGHGCATEEAIANKSTPRRPTEHVSYEAVIRPQIFKVVFP